MNRTLKHVGMRVCIHACTVHVHAHTQTISNQLQMTKKSSRICPRGPYKEIKETAKQKKCVLERKNKTNNATEARRPFPSPSEHRLFIKACNYKSCYQKSYPIFKKKGKKRCIITKKSLSRVLWKRLNRKPIDQSSGQPFVPAE